MIRINAFIKVDSANREAVLTAAKELVSASLREKGCIAYDIFESSTRNDVMMICETWTNEEDLHAHEKAEAFKTIVPKILEMASMKIEKLNF